MVELKISDFEFFPHEGVQHAAEDSASCSCLEGNPCAVRYSCKNWKNRFEVAKQARIAKHGKDVIEQYGVIIQQG